MKKYLLAIVILANLLTLTAQNTMFLETFDSDSGQFAIHNILIPTGTDYVWKHDVYKIDGFMKANAGVDGSQASEAWLISKAFDLSSATNASLTFDHAAKFQNGNVSEEFTVWISTKTGDTFNIDDWTQLTIPTFPTAGTWNFVSSGSINLNNFVGSGKTSVRIGFRYKTTSTAADAWEISKVEITGDGTPIPDSKPIFVAANIVFNPGNEKNCNITIMTDTARTENWQINYNSYTSQNNQFVGTYTYNSTESTIAGTFSMLGSMIKQFENGSLTGESLMKDGSLTISELGDSLYQFVYSATKWTDKTYSGTFMCKATVINAATGLNNITMTLPVYAKNKTLFVYAEIGQDIIIYNMFGQKIYNTSAQNHETVISGLPNNQMLIVRSNNTIAKVIID
jgi:hypothetical protein